MAENPGVEEARRKGKEALETLLRLMDFEATVEDFAERENQVLLHVESEDAGRLIGRGAQVLDALQYVVTRILYNRDAEHDYRYIVDVERYRERKQDRLKAEARDVAERVASHGRPYRFPPMSASDRRVIHQALKDREDVRTQSEYVDGEDRKSVVVHPVSS